VVLAAQTRQREMQLSVASAFPPLSSLLTNTLHKFRLTNGFRAEVAEFEQKRGLLVFRLLRRLDARAELKADVALRQVVRFVLEHAHVHHDVLTGIRTGARLAAVLVFDARPLRKHRSMHRLDGRPQKVPIAAVPPQPRLCKLLTHNTCTVGVSDELTISLILVDSKAGNATGYVVCLVFQNGHFISTFSQGFLSLDCLQLFLRVSQQKFFEVLTRDEVAIVSAAERGLVMCVPVLIFGVF